jgi:hypothetical protein
MMDFMTVHDIVQVSVPQVRARALAATSAMSNPAVAVVEALSQRMRPLDVSAGATPSFGAMIHPQIRG